MYSIGRTNVASDRGLTGAAKSFSLCLCTSRFICGRLSVARTSSPKPRVELLMIGSWFSCEFDASS